MRMKRSSTCWRCPRRAVLACAVAGLALCVPTVTLAERPSTAPSGAGQDRSERRPDRERGAYHEKGENREKGERGPDRGGFQRRGDFKPTDDEWAEAAAFMRDKSPHLWEMYEKIPDKHKTNARKGIYLRYLALKNLAKRDEALYEIEMERMRVEDDLFGLVGKIRAAPREDREQKMELLRPKVEELWAVRVKDRELHLRRIERQLQGFKMEKALAELRREWQADLDAKEKWIEDKVKDYRNHVERRGRPGPPPKDERSGGEDSRRHDCKD